MRMTVFALAMVAAGLPAAASADTTATEQFRYEGVAYSYSVTETAYGQLVEGKADSRPFALQVRKAKVVGTVNGRPVSFNRSEVQPMVGIVEVALR